MFTKLEFIKSVYHIKDLPKDNKPEVILCGRSNVGKSSFINTILNRKGFAKTSSTPGKTRSINYYNIDDKFYFVDLPGYGYAKTSKEERDSWAKLMNEYFEQSANIALAIHLIDSRHNPMQPDFDLNNLLKGIELPYIVLLNKVDKLKQQELANAKKMIVDYFPELNLNDNLFLFSSVKGIGKKDIIGRIYNLFYK